jgi:hypothetical protein
MKRVAMIVAGASLAVPSVAHARSCHEVSEYVGEQQCSRYGQGWSIEGRPNIDFRFGFRYAGFSPSGRRFGESYDPDDKPKGYRPYAYDGAALGTSSLRTLGTDGGVVVYLGGQLYLGLEGGIGVGSVDTSSLVASGEQRLSDARGLDLVGLHGGALVGYRIPLGRASLRTEMLFGGTGILLTQYLETPSGTERSSSMAGRFLIEPRISGEIWFTQHVTFGAYAGTNLFDASGGQAFGLTLAWHVRAFNGDMSLW